MTALVVANLILTVAMVAVAAGFGFRAYRKHDKAFRHARASGDPAADYAPRRNWTKSAGKVNYSSFVYFDLDRDGRYSAGDRPMSGIAARLSGAGGHILTARTNANGFANFIMSSTARRAHIATPGTYHFAISIPPGWTCTSGNAVQSNEFVRIEGAPAGIGSEEMVRPVGLAPIRHVSGRTGAGSTTISFGAPGLEFATETIGPNTDFRILVPDGANSIAVGGEGMDRRLMLTPYPTHLGILSADRPTLASDVALKTIDFDAVTPRNLRKTPSGYAGLNWFNLNAISRDFQGSGDGYVNGNTSGDHVAYTSSGHPGELWSAVPFGFHSVMITAAWLAAEGDTARIESWGGDRLLASDEVSVSALTPVLYAPMLAGVTRIRFSSRHYWQLVIDDLVLAR
jgi:hypothetical protein